MDDVSPGWKVWSRDPTPADLLQLQKPANVNEIADASVSKKIEERGPKLKPCLNDELDEDRERVLESLRRLKAQHALEKSEEAKVKPSTEKCTVDNSSGVTITLRQEHLAQAFAFLLLLQMVQQFHVMSSRILVLEASMRR